MNYYYCKSCGSPTPVSLAPPKFCSSCGTVFASQSQPLTQNTSVVTKPKISKARQEIILDDENEHLESLPEINKLEYTVKGVSSNRGVRIKDILGSEAIDTGRVQERSKKSNKKILAEFRSDATPRGKSNPIEISG